MIIGPLGYMSTGPKQYQTEQIGQKLAFLFIKHPSSATNCLLGWTLAEQRDNFQFILLGSASVLRRMQPEKQS